MLREDIRQEIDNWYGDANWINRFRQKFSSCFFHDLHDLCKYKKTRFHWTDHHGFLAAPHTTGYKDSAKRDDWIRYVNEFFNLEQNKHLTCKEWEDDSDILMSIIRDHVKTEEDCIKIILGDAFFAKEAERSTITNWRQIVQQQFTDRILPNKQRDYESYGKYDHKCRLLYVMYDVLRFQVEVYALLRMFRRKKDAKTRFKNIIFHAGQFHTDNLREMLLKLNYQDTISIQDETCIRLNMIEQITFD